MCRTIFTLLAVSVFSFFSCKKDDPAFPAKVVGQHIDTAKTPVKDTANTIPLDTTIAPSFVFTFNAFANNQLLIPVHKFYTNESHDNFSVTKFNYYISNVKIYKTGGTAFSEPESYHLMQHVEGINSFTINNVPPGEYNKVEFIIGVDSLRNVSGAQSGDLDPALNMFWDWNTGYIFFKLEGDFTSNSVHTIAQYGLHIGGFEGKSNCLQAASHSLSVPLIAKKGKKSKITYKVVIDEVFKNPRKIGLDDYYNEIKLGPEIFKSISDNYRDMFVVDAVQN